MSINIFNRREILLTRDLEVLNRATAKLKANNIDYKISTNSITNPGRTHGVVGIQQNYSYEYRLYINKNDYKNMKGLRL